MVKVLLSFHNKTDLKKILVEEITNENQKSKTFNDGIESYYGNFISTLTFEAMTEKYGWDIIYTSIVNKIYQNLPANEANEFKIKIVEMTPIGVNLAKVSYKLISVILKEIEHYAPLNARYPIRIIEGFIVNMITNSRCSDMEYEIACEINNPILINSKNKSEEFAIEAASLAFRIYHNGVPGSNNYYLNNKINDFLENAFQSIFYHNKNKDWHFFRDALYKLLNEYETKEGALTLFSNSNNWPLEFIHVVTYIANSLPKDDADELLHLIAQNELLKNKNLYNITIRLVLLAIENLHIRLIGLIKVEQIKPSTSNSSITWIELAINMLKNKLANIETPNINIPHGITVFQLIAIETQLSIGEGLEAQNYIYSQANAKEQSSLENSANIVRESREAADSGPENSAAWLLANVLRNVIYAHQSIIIKEITGNGIRSKLFDRIKKEKFDKLIFFKSSLLKFLND